MPMPMATSSVLSRGTIDAVVRGCHGNPFAVLGMHEANGEVMLRAFVPGADVVDAVTRDGHPLGSLKRRHAAGFFEGVLPARAGYLLRASNAQGQWTVDDAYAYGPVLGPLDVWLLGEGTHARLPDRLGAHVIEHEGAAGAHFAVWAPNARRVSVVGDFNGWDGRRHVMRKLGGGGVWEIFIPGLNEGALYKYEVIGKDGTLLPLKADPVGFGAELRPGTASVIRVTDNFAWSDQRFIAQRAQRDPRRAPMAIYEVRLGSWRRGNGGRSLTYDELADTLVPYVVDLGFTHVELMPVNEYPLDESWGYQPLGLFAPTARFGTPDGFARFVDRCHAAGLGVLLDWVSAHFPEDAHGLAWFDGTPLYEHADPMLGKHPDWQTAVFDFGKPEVVNYLVANARFWLDRYHVDGLRVDAVASMLYLDYSRKQGQWRPNRLGGNQNLEAVAFLRRLNEEVYAQNTGAVTIAEESTSWPLVSQPTYAGGLGFGFKWNMGWMHDTLAYLRRAPAQRRAHHREITFGLTYAFAENFVLPLSHDEVVHGKGSLLRKIPGDASQKIATVRACYAFMWAYPGKKLLFMGQEFAQDREWDVKGEIDWALLEDPAHAGVRAVVRDCNRLYRTERALHESDCEPESFAWLVVDDAQHATFAWLRQGGEGVRPVAAIVNFAATSRSGYRLPLPRPGRWREILNTDATVYGGTGAGNAGTVVAEDRPGNGQRWSAVLTLPPLAAIWLTTDDD